MTLINNLISFAFFFFFSSRRRHTRCGRDWSSDVCSSDLRFNKAQQDAFLPFVEQGLLTFIGATTENPSFEVNSALLSRATVYVLEPLSIDELAQLLDCALDVALPGVPLDDGARAALIGYADGDGRRFINLVE